MDPGINGAAVLFVGDSLVPVEPNGLIDLPTIGDGANREIDVIAYRDWLLQMEADVVVVERARAMPSIGGEDGARTVKMGATSAFNYGGAYRVLRAIPQAFNLPVRSLEPTRWKKYYGLKGGDKERSRQLAIERWPSLHALLARKKDHQRAEAILMAAYFWKVECDDEIPE